MMNDLIRRADEVLALAAKATPGPWEWVVHDVSMATLGQKIRWMEFPVLSVSPCKSCQKGENEWEWSRCHTPSEADAAFIARAPDMAALIAAMRAELVRQEADASRPAPAEPVVCIGRHCPKCGGAPCVCEFVKEPTAAPAADNPHYNLEGAIYDIEHNGGKCDAVSLATLKRVSKQIAHSPPAASGMVRGYAVLRKQVNNTVSLALRMMREQSWPTADTRWITIEKMFEDLLRLAAAPDAGVE